MMRSTKTMTLPPMRMLAQRQLAGGPTEETPMRKVPRMMKTLLLGIVFAALLTGLSSGRADALITPTTSLGATPNPSSPGQTVTLRASVYFILRTPLGDMKRVPVGGGEVTFYDGGAALGSVGNSQGQVTFSTSSLAPGTHALSAVFSGSSNYTPSTSNTVTQKVVIAATTVLTSSANPSVVGQPVTFTAAVTAPSGDPTPTGAVQFAIDGTSVGSPVTLDGSGQATDTEAGLSAGSHSVTIAYAPTGAFTGNTTAGLIQTVTGTALTSSANPSFAGHSVTFTAAVTAASGDPTPTGTVQFAIDGTSVGGPVTLDGSGQATDTEAGLSAGSHSVTVAYVPTGAFTGSTTAALTQSVIAHVSPQYVSPTGSDRGDGSQGSPKLTIQAAINATESGDTVIVEDGTYTGPGDVDLDFGGRNVTVASVNGPASTIIDCGGSSSSLHRGFFFHSGETGAVVSGLTLENGYSADTGGAVSVAAGCTVTLANCALAGNYAAAYGGGVYNGGAVTLTNCAFTGNSVSDGNGPYSGGGGVYDDSASTATLTGCTFTGNTSGGVGGGVYSSHATVTLTGCAFTGNGSTNDGGGGVCNSYSTATLTGCAFTGNTTNVYGGGVFNSYGSVTMTNCTLTNNTAGQGGGVVNSLCTVTLTNCTLTGNRSTNGGGMCDVNSDTVALTNCLLYGDGAGEISGSGVTATYCDIQGGYAGTNNLNADPLFVSASAPYDLHLQPGSPCLGAGTAAGAPATDLDGNPRPTPPSIGAYDLSMSMSPVTHLLWSNPDGKAAFWDVDGSGNVTGVIGFGPYADGQSLWHATALATGPDGVSHILWNNPDGHVALWNVTDSGSVTGNTGFGPYADGPSLWSATSLSVGPDNVIHLLWTNPDRKAAFWNVTQSGSVTGVTGYGPYFDGGGTANPWIAFGVSTGPDNVSHLVWANTDGTGAFWDLNGDGGIASVTGYGPYTDGSAGNLWYSLGISTGPDNVSHLLWNNVDAKAAFWNLDGSGNPTAVAGFGPYADGSNPWHAAALVTGPDDVSRLVWNNPDGHAALWTLNGSGGVSSVTGFGPYVDGVASNLWSAVGVSAGP